MLSFQQSETTAERRRWIIILVDSTDGVTGLTGQTGTVFISKNGGDGVASTNSIVEVDSGDMPGHYYLELTAGELDTLGFISITKKTAGSLAFHDRAIVSYNDPYISAGGFATGGSGDSGPLKLTAKQMDLIAERVWSKKFRDKETAKDILFKAADHPPGVDLSGIESKIDGIEIPVVDLSPVLSEVKNIKIPQPKDYTKSILDLQKTVEGLKKINMSDLKKAVSGFNNKVKSITGELGGSSKEISNIKDNLLELNDAIKTLSDKADELSDMDRRFENMTSIMQKQELSTLVTRLEDAVKKILITVTNNKYDILENLNNDNK